jgi:hypothetical protein
MTTMYDFDRTAAAPRVDDFDRTAMAPHAEAFAQTAAASREDFDRTAFAPRGDDSTSAWAWSSSPLGEPSDDAEDLPYGDDRSPEPVAPAVKRKPIKKLIVAAGLIGVIGSGTALVIALSGSSHQAQSSSGTTAVVAAVAPQAAVSNPSDNGPAPAPAANPTDNGPTAAPVVAAPDNAPAPAPAFVPPPNNAPPANLGTPLPAGPAGPVVKGKVPPSVWIPAPPPQLPPPPSPPQLPAPPKLPPLPGLCLPPHPLVQGACK